MGDRATAGTAPGARFERTDYRFELVTDYGAFRDLQRHRLCTIEWQQLGCSLGADVPAAVTEAGCGATFAESLARSKDLYDALRALAPDEAGYAVALAYRIRYVMQLNAREAMHVLELRSGPQGHPAYRRVAQEMHRQIADVAGHRAIAAAMRHVDYERDRPRAARGRAARRGPSARARPGCLSPSRGPRHL